MSIARAFSTTGHQRASCVIARKRRIKERLSGRSEEAPSIAGWEVYVASAVAFLIPCVVAALPMGSSFSWKGHLRR